MLDFGVKVFRFEPGLCPLVGVAVTSGEASSSALSDGPDRVFVIECSLPSATFSSPSESSLEPYAESWASWLIFVLLASLDLKSRRDMPCTFCEMLPYTVGGAVDCPDVSSWTFRRLELCGEGSKSDIVRMTSS